MSKRIKREILEDSPSKIKRRKKEVSEETSGSKRRIKEEESEETSRSKTKIKEEKPEEASHSKRNIKEEVSEETLSDKKKVKKETSTKSKPVKKETQKKTSNKVLNTDDDITTSREIKVATTKRKENSQNCKEAQWDIPEVLAESFGVPLNACKQFTSLIEEECTLPFIARYRKEVVGNLDIEVLRKMKSSMEELQKVQGKISSVINNLEKQKVLTPSLNETICNIKDLDELELCYAPYKDTKKKTLVARAIELGLEDPALKLLNGKYDISPSTLLNEKVEGLDSIKSIELGIQHVIADVVGKNKENVDKMSQLVSIGNVLLSVTKSRNATKQKPEDITKFQLYFDKTYTVSLQNPIKHHVFLAISRGEDLKILSVKYVFPRFIEVNWVDHCKKKYLNTEKSSNFRTEIILKSINDAYSRIVEPLFARKTKSRLTEAAHNAAVEVFARNLKSLLLSPPLPNTTVLGLDPGFKHGCKCAVVSPTGTVLHTETIYIVFDSSDVVRSSAATSLRNIVRRYQCSTFALGNGTACRETEAFLSKLIQEGLFHPLDVKYTIVNEAGASIYSCSPEAKQEFPSLDPNVISAISIARRLQDPLTEYVRVSPQHIGIGMYQHDISVKKLESALDEIVSECVSFVGVDLNSCPLHVLSKIAGLTENKAKKLIDYRNKHGLFVNRQQILDVPTIGPKTFQQCAGFLTIRETTSVKSVSLKAESSDAPKKVSRGKKVIPCCLPNPLDRTCVHPESYELAYTIMDMFKANANEIGHESFIYELQRFLWKKNQKEIALELGETEGKIEQIISSLSQPTHYDLRANFEKPIFKRSVTSIYDLQVGQELTGRVNNVTDFGAFVDIGVGKDALLHNSKMRGKQLSVTNQVTVRVAKIDTALQRISLELVL